MICFSAGAVFNMLTSYSFLFELFIEGIPFFSFFFYSLRCSDACFLKLPLSPGAHPPPPRPSSSVNVSEFRNDMWMRGDSSVRSSVSRMATGDERWQLVTAMSVTCSSLRWHGLAGARGCSWRICPPHPPPHFAPHVCSQGHFTGFSTFCLNLAFFVPGRSRLNCHFAAKLAFLF